jgi:hypothetical protein
LRCSGTAQTTVLEGEVFGWQHPRFRMSPVWQREGSRMTNSVSELERQLNELTGALNLLVELRQEFAQWLEEAEDGSKREELENVLGHIEALEREHRNRREELQKKKKSA